jgi:hypothetical protein
LQITGLSSVIRE